MGYKGSLKDKWIRELGEEKGLERWKVYKEKLSNRPYTNEHRKKLSEAKKGKKFTEEHKKRYNWRGRIWNRWWLLYRALIEYVRVNIYLKGVKKWISEINIIIG